MEDLFIEKIVPQRADASIYVKRLLLVLAFFLLVFLMLMLPSLASLWPLIFVGGGYAVYYVWTSMNLEHEYILVNEILDIDRIIAKRKRKRLIELTARDVEEAAPLSAEKLAHFRRASSLKLLDVSSRRPEAERYYLKCRHDGENMLIIMDYEERIFMGLRRYNPSAF
ncbi:MAG: hypothetical protein Q4P72_05795 [Eubacteriales bacterium]|nr:hypothetical protein [Eubacteriales bacterium]